MNRFEGRFLLPWIYSVITWLEAFVSLLEELISVISVPLLSFGVSMTMIDFFVQGQLSKDPNFALSWSIIQAISIDAQIAYTWHKARRAWHQKKYLPFLGFLCVGVTLAFVVWGASSLEGLDHATGTGTLASFGMTPQMLVGIRMAVAVVLLCIAGWTRRLIAELDDIPVQEKRAKPREKPVSIFVIFEQKIHTGFFAVLSTITFKKWRENHAQKLLESATTEGKKEEGNLPQKEREKLPEIASKSDEKVPEKPLEKTTQKLPTLEEVTLQKRSMPVNIRSRTKLTKNCYSKVEAAQVAKCRVSDIENALKSGHLFTAANSDKVLKSSLKRFMVERQNVSA